MFTFGAKPNPKMAVTPGQIRVEKAAPPKKPTPLPSKTASWVTDSSRHTVRPVRPPPSKPKPKSGFATPDRLDPNIARKRKAARQKSPAQPYYDNTSSEDEVESPASSYTFTGKRQRSVSPVDLERQLRADRPFSAEDSKVLINAADVANPNEHGISIELQYPASTYREKYRTFVEAAEENKGRKVEELVPVAEFIKISKIVAYQYLAPEQQPPFTDPEPYPGLLRKLERAGTLLEKDNLNEEKQQDFKDAVEAYNVALDGLMRDGTIQQQLGVLPKLPSEMVDFILNQVYERAVSPQVKTLTKLRSDEEKDNTYGELLHNFVSKIIKETKLTSKQVFVDLGSGVGNVVLQTALEVGCESWGCEMMAPACTLARAQEREFEVRCRLWGVKPGLVRLEEGDFRENHAIKEALKRADVILVNNEVFGSELNQRLVDMFLDVKDGCKIVSLKSFVPLGHKMTERNANNPVNLLRNEQKEYYEGFVSWKNDRGTYFIATKDSKRLERFSQS